MKTKLTALMILVIAFSSSLYSQNSRSLTRERKSRTKTAVEAASAQEAFFYGLSKSQKTLGAQKKNSGAPGKPESYMPGFYYIEGFEEGTLPQGWQTRNVAGVDDEWEFNYEEPYIGNYSAYMNYSGEKEIGVDWLITPQYTAFAGDSLVFYITPADSSYVPDTLWVLVTSASAVPTDSADLDAAFSDTLLTIAVDTLWDKWNKFSVSLDKYAGSQIYIGFKEFNIYGCGLILDNVCLGIKPDNDISAVSISIETGLKEGNKFSPAAVVQNAGSNVQSFSVKLEIGDWFTETLDFTDVAPDSVVAVNFSEAIVYEAGDHTAELTIISATDENPTNNSLSVNFHVIDVLAGAKWHSETPLPSGNAFHAAASYTVKSQDPEKPDTNYIYVFGGDTFQDAIFKYNDVSKVWSNVGYLPVPLSYHTTAQISGKAYIMGGSSSGSASSALIIYDMEKDTFTIGAPLPEPLASPVTGVYGDSLIYLAGGHNPTLPPFVQEFNEVYIYNIHTDTWSEAESLPGFGGVSMAGDISGNTFIVAGSGGIMGPEVFDTVYYGKINPLDPASITWTKEHLPMGPVAHASSGSWSGKEQNYIFIAGGTSDYNDTLSSVWIYDVEKELWLAGEDKITPVMFSSKFVPVIRNDSVYMVVTGGSYMGNNTNANEWLYLTNDKPLTNNNFDVFASSVDFDTVTVGLDVIPTATFGNKQLGVRNFTVTMEITPGGYIGVDTVENLAYNAKQLVSFTPWIPADTGTYIVKVYASLSGDEDMTNDTLVSQIFVQTKGLDAAPFSVDFDTVAVNAAYTPKATFENKERLAQTFVTYMEITPGGYVSVDIVENLAPHTKQQISFTSWTPADTGTYNVKVYTYLSGDENLSNDTLSSQVVVVNQGIDAAPFSVDFDTVTVKSAFVPKATFINNQVKTQTFVVTMQINPGSYVSVDTVTDLAYGEKEQVSFSSWTPDSAGAYTVKVFTTLPFDENKNNDTLTSSVIVINKIGIDDEMDMIPDVYSLSQNYPNPFNPTTVIRYGLPEAGQVELKVYDMLGREVQTLVSEYMNAGMHEVRFNAAGLNLSSGVYIYRIKSGTFVQTKKLMLIK